MSDLHPDPFVRRAQSVLLGLKCGPKPGTAAWGEAETAIAAALRETARGTPLDDLAAETERLGLYP